MRSSIRSILAATDLDQGSDAIVRSAAILAQRTGAELHLLHSLELPWVPAEDVMRRTGFFGQIESAEERLQAQVERTMPDGVRPASQKVIIYIAPKAIMDRAEQVSADLIVLGPHRGGATGVRFLGTTADRVIRTADVPCLIVEEPLTERVRSIGVPVDFSDPSQGALEAALEWSLQLAGGTGGPTPPRVRVMHVALPVEYADPALAEEAVVAQLERLVKRSASHVPGAETLDIQYEVVRGNNPTEATVRWARSNEVDLLVMGTHGRSGLRRALIGSVASSVARQVTTPVLLVPPSLWSGHAHTPNLDRVLIPTDFSESSMDAVRWSSRELAPEAEHVLVHVLENPDLASPSAGGSTSREDLVRSARGGAEKRLGELRETLSEAGAAGGGLRTEVREGEPAEQIVQMADDVDLLVMGACGRSEVKRGSWTMLGSTVERVLRASPAPVLVVRGTPGGPPRQILAAVDGSKPSLRALSWADFLRSRFGGVLEVLYVEPAVYAYPGSMAGGLDVASPESHSSAAGGLLHKREEWLREQIRRAGVDPSSVEVRVTIGSSPAEIIAESERYGADLIVVGTHGRGTLGRVLLGSVASAVLRTASCSVLAVGDPERTGV